MKKAALVIAKYVIVFIIFSAFGVGIYTGVKQKFDRSYNKGVSDGFGAAIDTVIGVMRGQKESDTSVTELVLINPDTTRIYLSRKTPLNKNGVRR